MSGEAVSMNREPQCRPQHITRLECLVTPIKSTSSIYLFTLYTREGRMEVTRGPFTGFSGALAGAHVFCYLGV